MLKDFSSIFGGGVLLRPVEGPLETAEVLLLGVNLKGVGLFL